MKVYRQVLLAFFAVGLVFSISGALIFAGLLLLDFFVQMYRKRNVYFYQCGPLTGILIVFFAWGGGASLLHHSVSMGAVVTLQSTLLLVYMFASLYDDHDMKIFLTWIVVATTVSSFQGMMQAAHHVSIGHVSEKVLNFLNLFTTHPGNTFDGRSIGTRNHPITYAESLIPGYFLLLIQIVKLWTEKKRFYWFALSCLVIVIAGVFFSQTRGVWLGLMVGTMIMGFLWNRRMAIFFFMGIVICQIFFLALFPSLRGRVLSTFSYSQGSEGDQQSKATRYELWQASIDSIKAHPISGVGLKGAQFVLVDPVNHTSRTWSESHNIYLQNMVDLGLPGFVFFIVFVVLLFGMVWQLPPFIREAGVGGLIAFLVCGLTESWMGDREIALLFWVFVGCLIHVYKNRPARHV